MLSWISGAFGGDEAPAKAPGPSSSSSSAVIPSGPCITVPMFGPSPRPLDTPIYGTGANSYYRSHQCNDRSPDPPPMGDDVRTLNEFLQQGRAALQAEGGGHVTVVMGNEAADLDSVACSIAYARLLATQTSPSGVEASTAWVPLINMRRADLALHAETAWALSAAGVDIQALVFVDEVASQRLEAVSLVLVDHNKLTPSQEPLSRRVAQIVDHHADSGLYPWVSLRCIEAVGSCSTLVAEMMSEKCPELLGCRPLSKMLLGAILLDTVNLAPGNGRTTTRDEVMAALLMGGAGPDSRMGLFNHLQGLKFNQGQLATQEILRRDYKQCSIGTSGGGDSVIGISSVGLPLEELTAKDNGLDREVSSFMQSRSLDVLVIMAAYESKGSFQRGLAVVPGPGRQRMADDLTSFLASAQAGLHLRSSRAGGGGRADGAGHFPPGTKTFAQGATEASRKVVLPLIAQCFSD